VHVAFLGAEVHGGTLLGWAAPINTSNDFVFGVTQTSRAVNVGVGAEFLNEVYLNRQAFAGFAQREVFGANTEADLVQFGLGEDISLDGIDRAPKLHSTIHHGNFQNVHRGGANEAGNEEVVGVVVHATRGITLLQDAVLEHRNAVTHCHGLALVVRDVHRGDAEATLQRGDLGTRLDTQLCVQGRKRLIHEEDLRGAHNRAAHRDTLTLTTREGARLAVKVFLKVEDLSCFFDAFADFCFRYARNFQSKAHVVRDCHVGVERVVLENHCNIAVFGLHIGDVTVTDVDTSGVDFFQACEHAQGGRFTATGGADEDEEFAVLNFEI